MLQISVEKMLDLLDVNSKPLQDLESKFKSVNAELRWKGDIGDMPMDWWEGKIAYYKYKG